MLELSDSSEKEMFDVFAVAALNGLLAARCPDALQNVDKAASFAYDYAEAMVLERWKHLGS